MATAAILISFLTFIVRIVFYCSTSFNVVIIVFYIFSMMLFTFSVFIYGFVDVNPLSILEGNHKALWEVFQQFLS